jgi:site-specific DNA recombinase
VNGESPEDIMMRQVLAAFSEYERQVISARTKAALQSRIRLGKKIGRWTPYGFELDPDREGYVRRCEREQVVLEDIMRMADEGYALNAIARELNNAGIPSKTGKTWSHNAVKKIIARMRSRRL